MEHSLPQLLPARQLDLLRPDPDEGDLAHLVRAVVPGVVDALLHDEVAGLERLLLAAVQLEHDLARQHGAVVEAEGAVHGRAVLRRHVRHAKVGASRWHAGERLLRFL